MVVVKEDLVEFLNRGENGDGMSLGVTNNTPEDSAVLNRKGVWKVGIPLAQTGRLWKR